MQDVESNVNVKRILTDDNPNFKGITKGMMPNFYDNSRPTMVPTSSSLLGGAPNGGEQPLKKQQINEVLEGEEGSCPICNKTFSRKTSLLNHIRNHTAEKKYVCEYCQKGWWGGLYWH
ncbi:zinc finger protein [Culex quinquefasciatus]|uniref:Zinc finger protein n=1 Tax=Culex quinquefasciatus TaxID=7176 RepID=B0WSR2_CULQU|nr:zinc finger protein [Culex quinquefasciatus]|eukprot:XP_001853269.1 zinc finger protein [Culex quinquefasciatus]